MPGLPTIYVNFSTRDSEGRLYVARLSRFSEPVQLAQRFIGTDFDEFEVECEILAIDYVHGRVYHRPVRPADVPGTFDPSIAGEPPTVPRFADATLSDEGEARAEELVMGIA